MGRQHGRWLRMLVATGLFGMAQPVAGQLLGDPVAGARIAGAWCSNCHLVGLASPPGAEAPAQDAAPPFAALARRASTTRAGLQAFLQSPHRRMPDYSLTGQQREDVIAYLLSLRP